MHSVKFNERLGGSDNTETLQGGTVYQGHMPIGYNLEPTKIPRNTFFITALRELVAQKVSLYDYKASFPGSGGSETHRHQVQHLKEEEERMRREGVDPSQFFSTLLARKDEVVLAGDQVKIAPNFEHETKSSKQEATEIPQ